MLAKYKSQITNLIAILVVAIGYFSHNNHIFNMGIFAFSGAITNWLAIYMLFEKVPFLYGSGVIPRRFEDFKSAIKDLILEEFFTEEKIGKFLSGKNLDSEKINQKIDFNKVFEDLVTAIINSPLGGMLAMVGGKEALTPLKEPVILQLKDTVGNIISDLGKDGGSSNIKAEIEKIIMARLEELTPLLVKQIIEKIIHNHLGWLTVWGGVVGGVIGLLYSFRIF